MPSYKLRELPRAPALRGYVLATLRAQGADVYELPNSGGVVESRASWPPGTTGLTTTPSPVPGAWTLLNPAPPDP